MPLRTLVFLLFALVSRTSLAVCPPHETSRPSQVQLKGDSVLVVVHATSTHDARFTTKRGVDEAVRYAKEKKIPVIYLQDDSAAEFYFMEDCNPDHWVHSQGGEISFDVTPSHLYIAGGHLELCMATALHDILYRWAKRPARDLMVTYLMDAIYSNGKLIDASDPFYGDFVKFIDVVTYGRPGGEHWPKLSLLESMGVIIREDHQLEYLRQVLPRWDTTFPPDYRVELQLNDSVKKVLRSAPAWKPPTLLFHFVDSALTLSAPPRTAY